MYKYKISNSWFISSEIRKLLLQYIDKSSKNNILEIGCFEGSSSVFFADNLLDNINSSLTCVDPFLNINENDHRNYFNNTTENNFDYNLKMCNNSDKIIIRKISSDKFFESNADMFNLIYIDGCHEPEFIKRDMENSFKYLLKNGIMWMDDYKGGNGNIIKNTMDDFLKKYIELYEIIHIDYQLAIRKIV